jgi:hypothetical protein
MSQSHDIPPPIGAAPEDHDFSHPWVISIVVSTLSFVIGFAILYTTRAWSNFWQWADWPFLVYCAILTPVLLGFYIYGMCRLLGLLFRRKK